MAIYKDEGAENETYYRYHELFFMIDTCQANTMYSKIYSPNVLATGSSPKGENSYSVCSDTSWIPIVISRHCSSFIQHGADDSLGVALSDRYTLEILNYMERINKTSTSTMQDLFDHYDPRAIHSTPGVRTDLFYRPLDSVRITDFLGGATQVELTSLPDMPRSVGGLQLTY